MYEPALHTHGPPRALLKGVRDPPDERFTGCAPLAATAVGMPALRRGGVACGSGLAAGRASDTTGAAWAHTRPCARDVISRWLAPNDVRPECANGAWHVQHRVWQVVAPESSTVASLLRGHLWQVLVVYR